ncbi:MAG: hypothetical protein ACI86M_001998 [Saprospiraceae bacterium]|jgi:hypothetical protein
MLLKTLNYKDSSAFIQVVKKVLWPNDKEIILLGTYTPIINEAGGMALTELE